MARLGLPGEDENPLLASMDVPPVLEEEAIPTPPLVGPTRTEAIGRDKEVDTFELNSLADRCIVGCRCR